MMDEPIAEKQTVFQRMRIAGLSAWQQVVDVVTPPLCLGCQSPVTRGSSLCLDCWQKLNFIDDPVCDVLGIPFAYDEGEGAVSPAAIADPPGWDKARAAVAFDDASKHLVHLLKYRDTFEAAHAMARLMLGAGRSILRDADVLLPVPLHRTRLWKRRFNQAALLADRISKSSGVAWRHDLLVRNKATESQVGLTADERHKNVRRAFDVPFELQPQITGKTVLLIDDVRTTGATASACADCLKKAGAARVFVLTFALVLEPARLHIEA
jgi:ComF family protein